MLEGMVRDAAPLSGYPIPYDILCGVLQDGTNDWRSELDPGLGEEAVVWQPTPGGPSIGAEMLHVMAVEIFWIERFVLGRQTDSEERRRLMADEIDVDSGKWPLPPRRPIDWYFEWHDRIRTRTLEAIKAWPAADTLLDRPGEDWKYTPRWVLGHVIQHEAYHGGQIVLLQELWKRDGRG